MKFNFFIYFFVFIQSISSEKIQRIEIEASEIIHELKTKIKYVDSLFAEDQKMDQTMQNENIILMKKLTVYFPEQTNRTQKKFNEDDQFQFKKRFVLLYHDKISIYSTFNQTFKDGVGVPDPKGFIDSYSLKSLATPCNNFRQVCTVKEYQSVQASQLKRDFKPNEKAYAYGDKLWTNCIVLNFFMTRDYIQDLVYICDEESEKNILDFKWHLNAILNVQDIQIDMKVDLLNEDTKDFQNVNLYFQKMYVFAANNTTNKRQLQQLDIPPSDIFQIDLETHLSQPPFIISDPSLYKYDEDLFNILVFCLSNYKNSRACIGFPFFKDSSSNIKYFCTPNNSNDIKSKIFKFRQNDDDDMIKKYNTLSPTSNQQGFEDLLMFISYYYRLFLNIQKKISFAMVRNQQYTQGLPFMKAYVHEIQQSISNDCLNLHSKKSPNPEQTCKDIANYAIQKYLRDNICLENEECVTNLYRTSKLYKIQTKVHDVIAKDPMNPYSLPLYQQQILRDGRHEEFKFVKFIQALNTARYVIAQDVFVKGEEVQIPKNKDQGLKDDTDQDQQHRCSPLFANPTGKGKYKNKSKKEEFNSKYKDFSNNFCKNQYEPDVLSHFNDDLFVQVLPLVSDIDPFLKVFQVVEQFSPSLDWGIHDKRIDLELFKQDGYE